MWLQALRRSGQTQLLPDAMKLLEENFPGCDLQPQRDKTQFHLECREFMARCEAIGSGCEFGLLQRETGHEPLGLLRWSSISPASLVAGLKNRFAGIGSPENMTLSEADGEYYITESLYNMRMHTFISNKEPAETVFKQMSRRLTFLARKLVEDLELAEKIFVYKYADPIDLPKLSAADAQEIFRQLQTYGPNRMLYVEKAEPDERPGSVGIIENNLLRGVIGKTTAYDGVNDSDYVAWTEICSEVSKVFR